MIKKEAVSKITKMVSQLKAETNENTTLGECLRRVRAILPNEFCIVNKFGQRNELKIVQTVINKLSAEYAAIDKTNLTT